jgi:hypothetical protein
MSEKFTGIPNLAVEGERTDAERTEAKETQEIQNEMLQEETALLGQLLQSVEELGEESVIEILEESSD